jgi:hypothetical protein
MPKDPRKRRIAIALGAAAVLALIVLMQRRGGQATDAAAGGVPAGTVGGPGSSTFADNGEQATALGNTVTEGVGALQTAGEALATQNEQFLGEFQSLVESLKQPAEPAAAAPSAPGPLGSTATVPAMVAANRLGDDASYTAPRSSTAAGGRSIAAPRSNLPPKSSTPPPMASHAPPAKQLHVQTPVLKSPRKKK